MVLWEPDFQEEHPTSNNMLLVLVHWYIRSSLVTLITPIKDNYQNILFRNLQGLIQQYYKLSLMFEAIY